MSYCAVLSAPLRSPDCRRNLCGHRAVGFGGRIGVIDDGRTGCAACEFRSRRTAPGRDRDRRHHRPHVGVLRLLRLCDRFGAGVSEAGFPRSRCADAARSIRSRSSRSPSSRVRSAPSSSPRSTATYGRGVKLTVALFLLGSSTVAIAFLPGYADIGVGVRGAARAVPGRAGARARRRLGRPCLAAGDERAGAAARLVRDDPAARRAARPDGRKRLFAYFVANLSADDFFDWGWRYRLLRRLRHQRGGAVRAAAHRRDAGIRTAVRKPRPRTGAGHGNGEARKGAISSSAPSRRWRASRCSTW